MSETVVISREVLQALLDLATQSMDFGSGFLCDEDVEVLRAVAEVLGVDPILVTPSNFVCKFRGQHQWSKRAMGAFGGPGGDWYCRLCHHTSKIAPDTEGVVPAEVVSVGSLLLAGRITAETAMLHGVHWREGVQVSKDCPACRLVAEEGK